jgi:lysine-N-methylase
MAERPESWFLPLRGRNLFLIRKIDGKRCVFLDDENRCIIHKLHGENAKPLACRLYPFDIFPWRDGGVSAILRHDCPAVAFQKGKMIGERCGEIRLLASEIRKGGKLSDAVYSENTPTDLNRVRRIAAGYEAILLDESAPWPVRLYGCARLLEFHASERNRCDIEEASESFAADAHSFFRRSIDDLSNAVQNAPAPNLDQRIVFRYLMSGYARVDEESCRHGVLLGRILRAKSVLHFMLARGSLRALGAHYPDTRGVDPVGALQSARISDESFVPYRRFLASKLTTTTFCGNPCLKFTFEHGMRHLLLTLPLTMAFAALGAKTASPPGSGVEIGPDEVSGALMTVDHTYARSPFFQLRHVRKLVFRLCSTFQFPSILRLLHRP